MKWLVVTVVCGGVCGCHRGLPGEGDDATRCIEDSVMVGNSVPAGVSVPGGLTISIENDGEWSGVIEY